MKIVFDTNVVLDALLERPNAEAAVQLVQAAAVDRLGGLITANTITDIYYIARKALGRDGAKEAVSQLLALFDIIPVTGESCAGALELELEDYEDAVLAVCAAQAQADYIVTRDQGFLASRGPVPTASPASLFELLERS